MSGGRSTGWSARVPPLRVQRWHRAATLSLSLTLVSVLALALLWSVTLSFAAAVGTALVFQIVVFARAAQQTPERQLPETRSRLTPATVVTVSRGAGAVLLAGFLVVARPDGPLAWLPALLFGTAALLDSVDGLIARATDTESAFGARLDVEMDSLALLVGAAVAVRFGQAPVYYLSVGLVRYAFVAGLWLRQRRGNPVSELPPRLSRRVLGAVQMLVVFLALSPALGATESRVLAVVAMVPFLLGFVRDWWLVTGRR